MSASKDAPPSYATATSLSTTSTNADTSHLHVPQAKNGIPAASRRSMEDEHRPLPSGWIRQYDANVEHQFFVDTNAKPPRSIWTHPYDDADYLKSLSAEERERIQEEEHERLQPDPDGMSAKSSEGVLPPRPDKSGDKKGLGGLGRKFKDKVTGSTHEERQAQRAQREEEERQYYEAHQQFRRAMQRAQMTGEPQLLGKDKDGKDVYIEPPAGPGAYGGGGYGGGRYGGGGYGGYGAYGGGGGYRDGATAYNPYTSGPYANPNARFVRPPMAYNRPYGPGYGGGYGFPLAGGLMGGMLLGGLLF